VTALRTAASTASLVALATASLFALAPTVASAQRWRTLESSRQLADSAPTSVRIEYTAGRIEMKPTAANLLYAMSLRYDAEKTEPLTRFDSVARSVELGVRSGRTRWNSKDDEKSGELHVELSPRVPLDLMLELGAVQSDLQLGGLRLTDLSIKGGAADLAVRFDAPNAVPLRHLNLEVGAADVRLLHAGNANLERVNATVGVGSLDLDLTGPLTRDVEIGLNVALGKFKLRVAPETGVSIDATTFLADFDKVGLVKRGDLWETPGFDQASRRVRLRVKAAFGNVELIRQK
jgi:hypothetical protein